MDPPANSPDDDSIEGQSQEILHSATVENNNTLCRKCSVHPACWIAVLIISLAFIGAGILAAYGLFIHAALVAALGVVLYFLNPRHQDYDESVAPHEHTRTILIQVPHQMSKSEMEQRLIPHENVTEGCCEICLADITIFSNKDIVRSPNPACSHVFHKQCILKWLAQSLTCPCCREVYLPTVEKVEEGIAVIEQEDFLDEYRESEMTPHIDIFNYNIAPSNLVDSNDEEFWA